MKKFFIGAALFSFLVFPAIMVSAAGETPVQPQLTTLPSTVPTTLEEWMQLIDNILSWILLFGVILAVAFLLVAGVMYITSAGSPDRAGTAVKIIIYTVIGLAVLMLAWGIVRTVTTYFAGVQVLDN